MISQKRLKKKKVKKKKNENTLRFVTSGQDSQQKNKKKVRDVSDVSERGSGGVNVHVAAGKREIYGIRSSG